MVDGIFDNRITVKHAENISYSVDAHTTKYLLRNADHMWRCIHSIELKPRIVQIDRFIHEHVKAGGGGKASWQCSWHCCAGTRVYLIEPLGLLNSLIFY